MVLGIDAAWIPQNPSGIALLTVAPGRKPELLRAARACAEFTSAHEFGPRDWLSIPPSGETLNISGILDATIRHAGALPDVIALDIPLSPLAIRGRRPADNAISSKYGSRWAGTHTPSAKRPGPVSADLFRQVSRAGYYWINASEPGHLYGQIRYFLETYPHPVIIEMMGLKRRLCYKVAKRREYWPSLTPDGRWRKLASELDRLRTALALRIDGFAGCMPKACAILHSESL